MTEVLNNEVYLLCHSYEYDENEHQEIKILGIYPSKEDALLAQNRYYNLVGFNKYPKECFSIDRFIVGKDEDWTEGFINWDEASGLS